LNDDFSKLPENLQEIIKNPEKRKKLIIYINPPYAEAGSVSVIGSRKNKTSVATQTKIWNKYKDKLGLGIRELFAQFFIRICQEIPECKLASFSTLKYVSGDGFSSFRTLFNPEFKKGFIIPAETFDNVKGSFPIGFLIWNLEKNQPIKKIKTDAYDKKGKYLQKKNFYTYNETKRITDWIAQYDVKNKLNVIGYTGNNGPDFQNNNYCHISSVVKINKNNTPNNATKYSIVKNNLIPISVYFAVRHCIKATWLNDRDQFLFPNKKWEKDTDFQNDCLTFTLFHGQNRISSKEGTNHWIPFTEKEVNAKAKFKSNFMTDFIQGKLKQEGNGTLLDHEKQRTTPLKFSEESKSVFEVAKKLWIYYHNCITQNPTFGEEEVEVNASLYDIKVYFQGKSEIGRMNNKSENETYNILLNELRQALDTLAEKIEPKIYEYGFLKD
jgi:hypothetical protein